MRLLTTLIGLSVVVSCADAASDVEGVAEEPAAETATETATETETATTEPKEPLCDGSDELRFIYVNEGGGQTRMPYHFTEPHGHVFIAIDGQCRYYVEYDYMRGVLSGTLSDEDAVQFAEDMHWNELDGWVDWDKGRPSGSCFDAGGASLIKRDAAVTCSCDCSTAAPKGLSDAFSYATGNWTEKLLSEGVPLDGPVSALIDTNSHGGPAQQPVAAWPLERAIDSIPNLLLEPGVDPRLVSGSDQWARFDDPAESKKLRDLRTETVSAGGENSRFAPTILIKDGEKQYDLYVRDELPEGFEQSWTDLRDSTKRQ